MESIDKTNIKNLLAKLLADTLSEREQEQLRNHIGSSYKDKQLNELMSEHWQNLDTSGLSAEPSLENLKLKLWTLIQQEEAVKKQTELSRKISWQTAITRIAAILFIPLLVYTGFMLAQSHIQNKQAEMVMQKVEANPGSRVHFTLPDKTEVWLNSGSSLEYPIAMNKQKQRNVRLTGQGYFKVSYNPRHPFLVETNQINIKVLGTSFDVSNYNNDGQIITTLEEGCIALLDSHGREVSKLAPGQQAVLEKTSRKLYVENVKTELSTSWKDGRLIFRDAPLQEVVKLLGRWYNCNIEVDDSLIGSDIQYTATIQDETLGEVLQMIELSTAVKTSIKNREVRIWAK
ncbi:FecR domain-containing protein [Maribellus sp. CM-23]|uniref:FecR family protein n=1 Tax=Maribellus sp. CM-23 TaxID=2781026 RepID=UPI001F3F952C|nr:FecR domain-containing protein [Maribellus sp. CM-23]MCE4564754.1 FecR domain-containing protein [Maribellus sp. CM-23]